jgi:hypothetical protein
MITFELILQDDSPAAAIITKEITDEQLWLIYSMLPPSCFCQWDLAKRWKVDRVLASEDWASAQLRRQPMLQPKGIKLAFIN